MCSGFGVSISFVVFDCILTDFGVVNVLGVDLAGVFDKDFLGVFLGEDFPVTLVNLDFD